MTWLPSSIKYVELGACYARLKSSFPEKSTEAREDRGTEVPPQQSIKLR